jgi:glycine/D-amino acid oxidase-like deaminating enzyme
VKLNSDQAFWPIQAGLPASYPAVPGDLRCDVAVIGAGISGACAAWHLVQAGFDTVVVDRRDVGLGSTAGSTSLLQYEIDEPLDQLARRHGWPSAARAFARCREAIDSIERLVRRLRLDCGFERKSSLRLASQASHVARLRREFEARRRAGFPDVWWPRSALRARSSLPHPAAILSPIGGQLDAYRFTHGLLAATHRAGGRIFDRSPVVRKAYDPRGVTLTMAGGARIRCREVVIAAGYEADLHLPRRMTEWRNTYALVSEPVATLRGWPAEGCLIWETKDPYVYLRTTADRRVIIGGYDDPYTSAATRDRQIGAKTGLLTRRFHQLFPAIPLQVAYAWAGTFARTTDGLPWIGRSPDTPRTWVALGYGGNGITFSLIAAELIRDGLLGRRSPDAAIFGFGRVSSF